MEKFRQTLSQIQKANNTIFSVEFYKKDGSVRTMTARLHVKKGVKGTGMAYNPIEKGLLPVWDMQKNGFRMINLKTVTKLQIKGEELI
mgnify:CR=1 FL=1|tara:strand:- start:4317 stop:4580 length:264 start_codon:yes stop_codon:yes gene_type:complete